VVMNGGRIEQVGPPMELYLRPATRFVAEFIGSPAMNIMPATASGGRVRPHGGAGMTMAAPLEAARLDLGIRPEDLRIVDDSAPALYQGRATLVERLGEAQLVHLSIDSGLTLIVKLPRTARVARNDVLRVSATPDALHLFD